MSFKSQSGRVLALVVSCLVAVTAVSIAQITSNSRGVNPSRIVIGAFNATDTLIADGTVVIVDSLTAAQGKGLAVRPFDGLALNRNRVIGLAYGPIGTRASRSPGQVLIFGVHNNAKMGSSTQALNVAVRPGLLHGKLSTAADSLSMAVAWVIGFSPSNTATNPRAQVFWVKPGLTPTTL